VGRDGKPRFDLARFDPDYFDRPRMRVMEAGRRGIYVSIMLFEGWAMQHAHGAYEGHPFHPDNNIQEVKRDSDGDGKGLEIHTLVSRRLKIELFETESGRLTRPASSVTGGWLEWAASGPGPSLLHLWR
jgi:hypothetical protein